MAPESEIIRPAGLFEQYHITRCSLGFDSCVISAAQYISHKNADLDRTTLFCGLRKVIESHPALGVGLVGNSPNKASFKRLKEIFLPEVVEFLDSHNLQAVIEQQLMVVFATAPPTLPLWRLVVLKDNTLCFAWHHCIGDGISGLAFHRALLSELQKAGDEKAVINDIVTPSTGALIPAIENVVNVTPSWRKVIPEVFRLLAPVAWTRAASAWTGKLVNDDKSLETRVRFVEIPPDDAAALLAICRSHKATVTSAFHSLAIAVLSNLVSTKKYTTISSNVPISLRSIAGVSNDVFCDYVSTLHTYPRLTSTFSWSKASHYASRIKSYRAKSAQELGMLRFLFGDYASFFRGMVGKKRGGTLEISNVGHFDVPSTEKKASLWSIGRMVFAQCDAVVGPALKVNVVGDPLGGINLAVMWGTGVIADSLGEEFVLKFRDGIKKLLITNTQKVLIT